MAYVQGFVAAVPSANKEAYRKHVAEAAPLFKQSGATRMVETWGDDVPDGKVTDFKGAVKAKDDETVVFSWMEFSDKQARDAAFEKIMNDPRTKESFATMPFDGQRMIFGGFAPIVDEAGRGSASYVDGFVIPVPAGNKESFRAMAAKVAPLFVEHGAKRVVECWGDDVPDGKVTDFKGAVKAKEGEAVVFSWIEWPDKATRDAGMKKAMEDPRMQPDPNNMPFDGQRMIFGGFSSLLDA